MGNDIHKERTGLAAELYEEAKAARADEKTRKEFVKNYNIALIDKEIELIIQECRFQAKLGSFKYFVGWRRFKLLQDDAEYEEPDCRMRPSYRITELLEAQGFDVTRAQEGWFVSWR